MTITIKLAGVFRTGRFKLARQNYPAGSKAADVIENLQLPQLLVGIILINGQHAKEQDILRDGDTLSLLPLLDGG